MEDIRDFEALFRQAVAARGPAYLEARAKLLAMAGRPAVAARLRSYQQSTEPGQALVAIVLIGRMDNADAYRKAEDSIDGNYPKERYSRGRIIIDDPEWRARDARKHLGQDLQYLGLELLLKVHKYREPDGMSWGAASIAMAQAKDPRWNELLFAATSDAFYTHEEQLAFAGHMLDRDAPRILPYYRKYLVSPVHDVTTSLAFMALKDAKDMESVPRIKEIALDKKMAVQVREDAIDALVGMRIEDAPEILLRLLQGLSKNEKPLLAPVLCGLDDLGDRRAIAELKRLLLRLKGREDVEDRLNVKGTIEAIERRLADQVNAP
jgi:hypothetical protein